MIIKEFCAENFTQIPEAIDKGINRVELCDNMSVLGTTVSLGVMKKTIPYCHDRNVEVMTFIRPRGGNFIFSKDEIDIMIEDIRTARQLNSDGIVIGCLNKENWLDEITNLQLIRAAKNMEITFHLAFDQIPQKKQFEALDWLAENGVDRILTHGGNINLPIHSHFEHLKKLIEYSKNRIKIMPGGGVTYQNYQDVVSALGVNEVHGTKIIKFD